jgi:GAF domain-containing protein
LSPFRSDPAAHVRRLIEIGIALSAETDLDALLEKIVHHAREVTEADAGSLYLLAEGELHFRVVQNASLGDVQGGTTGRQIQLPPVPMEPSNVSAYAALTGRSVKIDDVYESEEFDFTGPRARRVWPQTTSAAFDR